MPGDTDTNQPSLANKVRGGSLWSLAGTMGSQVLSFGIGVALARLLAPADFGLIAASLLFLEIGSTVVGLSVVSTLVRMKSVSADDLDTGFVMQLVLAAVMTLVFILLSPLLASLMHDDALQSVFAVLSFSLLILAFRGIPTVIARRELNFRLISFTNITEVVGFGICSVLLAAGGAGVWSLVFGRLAGRTVSILHLWLRTRWRPRLRFVQSSYRQLLKPAIQFGSKEVLGDISRNVGYFFVGQTLGVDRLGIYSRAHYLMTLPVTQIALAVSSVLFPAFAHVQDDRQKLRRGVLKSTCMLTLLIFPLLIGLQSVAEDFIPGVYGAKWVDAVAPLEVICLAGLFYAADAPAVSLINALGLLAEDLRRQMIHIVVIVTGVLVGSSWGLVGVAAAVSTAAAVYWLLLVRLLQTRVGLAIKDYAIACLPALLACAAMALVIELCQRYWEQVLDLARPSLLLLFVCVAIGACSYTLVVLLINRIFPVPLWRDCQREYFELLGAKRFARGAVGRT